MTEYWVSQARHWCEYCRVYIAANKQSIAAHEGGKKHKEIVELSLRDMRKRGRERRIEREDVQKELERVERTAMKEYMAQDAGKEEQRQASASAAAAQQQAQHAGPSAADRAARLAELQAKISGDRLARAFAAGGTVDATPLPSGWRATTSPDGRMYYVHDATGAVQWNRPGAAVANAQHQPPAPPQPAGRGGWQQGRTEQGHVYYYNTAKGLTQWEEPPEWSAGIAASQHAATTSTSAAASAKAEPTPDVAAGLEDGAPHVKLEAPGDAPVKAEEEESGDKNAPAPSGEAPEGVGRRADDADGPDEVDENTGLGAWTTVTPSDEQRAPDGGWAYERRGEKRQRVAWATSKEEVHDEEEEERLEDIVQRFAVPDDMKEAIARHEAMAAKAVAAAEAATAPAVFAKRRLGGGGGGSKAFRKKTS